MPSLEKLPHDVFCTCLFFLNLVGFIIVSCFALSYGDPSSLVTPPLEQFEDEIYTFNIEEFDAFRHDYNWIALAIFSSIIASAIWFFVIKRLSAFMIYIAAMVGIVIISILGYYLYHVSRVYDNFELFLLALVCWTVSLLLAVMLFVFRDKILFTSKLLKNSGDILQRNLVILLLCLLFSMAFFLLILFAIIVILYLYSVPTEENTTLLPITISGDAIVVYDRDTRLLSWFVVVSVLWISQFLSSLETYIIGYLTLYELNVKAGTVAPERSPVLRAFKEAFVYSAGTIAFGALVKGILSLLSIFSKHNRNDSNSAPATCCTEYFVKLMKIIVDSIVDFAIIFSTFNNTNFWDSAKNVAKLLRQDAATAIFSKLIVHYIFTTGEIVASCFITLVTVAAIEITHGHLSFFVVVTIFFSSYFIFRTVSHSYTSVINTVLLVVLCDKNSPVKRVPEELTSMIQPSFVEI